MAEKLEPTLDSLRRMAGYPVPDGLLDELSSDDQNTLAAILAAIPKGGMSCRASSPPHPTTMTAVYGLSFTRGSTSPQP